jgi:agmatine deiminase
MMARRTVLKSGAAIAGAGLLGGCGEGASQSAWHMPLESDPHERTFMQWPVSEEVYGRKDLARVQSAIARIANTIGKYEPVAMLVGKDHAGGAQKQLGKGVALWDIPTDDLWCRDSGPTFVRNASGELGIAHLRFNGWGGKQPHVNDGKIAERVASRLGLPLLPTGLVGEQGGVEHDGEGTLLAHASCWANPNRNDLDEAEIGNRLLKALGGSKMIWAPGVKDKDITDYHIDALARFVGPGKVLIQIGKYLDRDDPWSISGHQMLRILEGATDAKGRKLEIIRLADPVNIRSRKPDFVASYVNYYVCNGAVIAAQFGDAAADARAKELLKSLYPGRRIEMIEIDAIGESGGGIHCATQQMPRLRTT